MCLTIVIYMNHSMKYLQSLGHSDAKLLELAPASEIRTNDWKHSSLFQRILF